MNRLRHLLRRTFRSAWENFYLNSVSAGVICAATLLVGLFLTVMFNLNRIVDTWDRDVHISAYFEHDVPVDVRFLILEEIGGMTEIAQARYVSEEDARLYLEERIPDVRPVLDELGAEVLPASIEISVHEAYTSPTALTTLVEGLYRPEFTDIDYGREWVERFNTFLSLLQLLGLILGGLIAVAAVFLVANTIHLVVYNRRDEIEVMRLVGATDTHIAIPFLAEGALQGLAGALLAWMGLVGLHSLLIVRLQEALMLSLAEQPLHPLPTQECLALVGLGMTLGILGSAGAVSRFLREVP